LADQEIQNLEKRGGGQSLDKKGSQLSYAGQNPKEGDDLHWHRRLRVWKKGRVSSLEKCVGSRKETKFAGEAGDSETGKRQEIRV
jgi:hypothetical protein